MAGSSNALLTYSDSVTIKIAVADYISVLGPWEVPIISYFGLNGDAGKFRLEGWPATETRWHEDAAMALTTALAASIASDATTFAVTGDDGYKLRLGNIIEVGSELMYVTSRSTDTLTVTRAFGGTSAATAASSTTVYIRGDAALENETSTQGGVTTPSVNTNYTQIFRDVLVVSGSEQVQERYGISDQVTYQTGKKMKEILRLMEQEFYYGKRTAGSASLPRSFGGIETFVTTNTSNLSSAALTEKAIEGQLQTIWEAGGEPTLAVCNAWVKRKINSLYRDMVRKENITRVGGLVVDRIETQFGPLDILMDRYCPTDTLYLLTPDEIAFLPFREFKLEKLAKSGDGDTWQIVGEYTMIARQDKKHGYIYGISTTS